MTWIVLGMVAAGFMLAWPGCALVLWAGRRMGLLDAAGLEAHKEDKPAVPNVGGIAVFWAVALPMAAVMAAVWFVPNTWWLRFGELGQVLSYHLPGLKNTTAVGGTLLAALAVVHVMGLFDDRRALGPWLKLVVQVGVAVGLATSGGSRVLELDALEGTALGSVLPVVVTVLWIVAITNAFNFLDNMDGLSAGVASVVAGVYLAATLLNHQWFVAALSATLLGALLAFLCFNKPPARLYLGDGGSLVVGLLLAVISIRTTYVALPGSDATPVDAPSGGWHGVLTPLVIMAIPLYDMVSVSVIRLREGRSPLSGDRNHFSHRLVRLGLSRPSAVAVIVLATVATGIGGVMMARLPGWQAALVASQAAAILATIALLERAAITGENRHSG